MSTQAAIPTNSAQHPAVTPSQASNTQSPAAPLPSAADAADEHESSRVPQASGSTPDSTQSHHPPLPLPSPETAGDDATTIEVNGARVSLADKLGPAVVNADGTMSRIANWAEMTEIERRNTVRILGQRNKIRLEALRAQEPGSTSGTGSG
jgi:hypothetical protein